jgi:hypothetical protein
MTPYVGQDSSPQLSIIRSSDDIDHQAGICSDDPRGSPLSAMLASNDGYTPGQAAGSSGL